VVNGCLWHKSYLGPTLKTLFSSITNQIIHIILVDSDVSILMGFVLERPK